MTQPKHFLWRVEGRVGVLTLIFIGVQSLFYLRKVNP